MTTAQGTATRGTATRGFRASHLLPDARLMFGAGAARVAICPVCGQFAISRGDRYGGLQHVAQLLAPTAVFGESVGPVADVSSWRVRTLDWMPWSHVAGTSVSIGSLVDGGPSYLDEGRPTLLLCGDALRDLPEVQPSFSANVPAAFAMLCFELEADESPPPPAHHRFQAKAEDTIGAVHGHVRLRRDRDHLQCHDRVVADRGGRGRAAAVRRRAEAGPAGHRALRGVLPRGRVRDRLPRPRGSPAPPGVRGASGGGVQAAHGGVRPACSAARVARFTIPISLPDPEIGEVSEKGATNQSIALKHRQSDVERLYDDGPGVRARTPTDRSRS